MATSDELLTNKLMAEYIYSLENLENLTINPEVGKCYEYQSPGEMREKNIWEYAGRFIKRTEFEAYTTDTKFFNDHFDNQNYIKDNNPEERFGRVIANVVKAKNSNFQVKQTWRPPLFWNRSNIENRDTFYREVECRDEYDLLINERNLALAKLLYMNSDNPRYEKGIAENILKHSKQIDKPEPVWKNKYGVSLDDIHRRRLNERQKMQEVLQTFDKYKFGSKMRESLWRPPTGKDDGGYEGDTGGPMYKKYMSHFDTLNQSGQGKTKKKSKKRNSKSSSKKGGKRSKSKKRSNKRINKK